jgi:hypothetical protein
MTVPGSLYTPTIRKTRSGYQIDQSIRFNFPDAAYMHRTPGVVGNRKTWTWSSWVKFNVNTNYNILFGTGGLNGTGNDFVLIFDYSTSKLSVYRNSQWLFRTSAQYRDPSAWYHIVWSLDTTSATADNRHRLYVNGSEVTSFSTAKVALPLNSDHQVNNTIAHGISRGGGSSGYSYDGYQSEINFIDGIALDPTSFGETNVDGVWVPKAYEGTYGTNGFYITGEDSAALGTDYSGNGNNFTSSGLTTDDQVTDTPTDNYSTVNPLSQLGTSPTASTFSDGNLTIALNTGSNHPGFRSTIAVDASDDTYMETTYNTHTGAGLEIGIVSPNVWASSGYVSSINSSYSGYAYGYRNDGQKMADGSSSAYGDSFTAGDVIGMRLNAGSLYFYKNGTIQNSGTALKTGLTGTWNFGASHRNNTGGTENITLNFGQSTFGNLPTGSAGWSTANLPTPAIKDGSAYFQTTLYTGNGTAIGSGGNAVSQDGNSTFQPDFVWIKGRSGATSHLLFDAVRGATKYLSSDGTYFETTGVESLSTFDTDGFTLGNQAGVNTNTATYAAWQWKANGAGVSNTDGTISSTVSVNQTAGFSVVTATAGASGVYSYGHGLGVKPSMFIAKNLDTAQNWQIWNKNLTSETTSYLQFTTSAQLTAANMWGAAPNSTTFSMHTSGPVVAGDNFVAYCFAEVEGFSKFGKYTGSGNANGPFVWCGFKPAFILVKETSTARDWELWDRDRSPVNVADDLLFPNGSYAETVNDANNGVDMIANGFKIRGSGLGCNQSSGTYIFMAFAEHPFGGDGVAPATAR